MEHFEHNINLTNEDRFHKITTTSAHWTDCNLLIFQTGSDLVLVAAGAGAYYFIFLVKNEFKAMNHRVHDKKVAAIRKTVLTRVLHLIFSSKRFATAQLYSILWRNFKNYSVNRKTAVSNYTRVLFTLQYITQQNFHLTNFSIYN